MSVWGMERSDDLGIAVLFYCFGTKMAVLSRDILSGETLWWTIIDDIS